MDKAGLITALTNNGLTQLEQYSQQISRSSLRISTASTSSLKIGSSRLGGQPDLPPGTDWPQWQGRPQSFIAQLQLSDLPHIADTFLPSTGMLWFFYDSQQQAFGDKPTDRGAWQVLFAKDTPATLRPAPVPDTLAKQGQFKARALTFSPELTLSAQPQLEVPGLSWTDTDQKRYDTVFAQFQDEAGQAAPRHRISGFPDTIQDDMRLQCQMMTHGVTDSASPQVAELQRHANDWQLLLQVDTDEQIGMRWGSSGMLYYWLPVDALRKQQFDQTWLVVQSE
ncbi:YwqG family protein [Tengunoibacter tsumagoiensis]|uniref:DUF1963 domain-containing protein n=1 Tax=Tengunoibacter tsumagoiensis TaxID=2014871 RepID=A0A402A5T5_9CHLR|nr:YwqG family protein [Tengunoibacter tsumagoiensis]GCE14470.1 hypothetical protein KTT_43290 [Tengunoibacter tsumagoiensis]